MTDVEIDERLKDSLKRYQDEEIIEIQKMYFVYRNKKGKSGYVGITEDGNFYTSSHSYGEYEKGNQFWRDDLLHSSLMEYENLARKKKKNFLKRYPINKVKTLAINLKLIKECLYYDLVAHMLWWITEALCSEVLREIEFNESSSISYLPEEYNVKEMISVKKNEIEARLMAISFDKLIGDGYLSMWAELTNLYDREWEVHGTGISFCGFKSLNRFDLESIAMHISKVYWNKIYKMAYREALKIRLADIKVAN